MKKSERYICTIRNMVYYMPIFTVNNSYDNTKSTIIDTSTSVGNKIKCNRDGWQALTIDSSLHLGCFFNKI